MKIKFLALSLVALALTLPVSGQKKKVKKSKTPAREVTQTQTMPPPVKITTVEGITEYQLHNGLRVLLFPDPSKQTITVNITYLVGSRHENYGETGMAHLLEHLVFKGTPKHPNIPQELTERGARPNGTTWVDRTNYFETFNATEDNLRWALDLEADRMVNSFISKEDLDSEMTVVRNEFEAGENRPFSVLMQRVMSTAYLWHNYGKSTIGSRADLENVPIERLQAFYKKYYQPDNAVLVVAGKIDEQRTLELVNETFGAIPRPTRTLQPTYTVDPPQDGERSVVLKRVGDVQVAIAAYHIPAGSHPDFPAVSVLSRILGAAPSGRLYKALVDSQKASSAGAFAFQWKEPSLLMAYAQILKEKSLDDALSTMKQALDDVTTNTPTEEEVERAKNELMKNYELMFNSSERIGLNLSEYIGMGDWRLLFLTRDRIEEVTVEDVARVAREYLKEDNRTVGQFIPVESPDRAIIPETPDVEALVKNYKGKENLEMGEAFEPSPDNIEARTERVTFDNGMEVAFLPKKTRGESVEARITLRFGTPESLANKALIGEFTASLLDKGTSKHTRQEIKDTFDKLKANVRVYGGASHAQVVISTTRPNLMEVLALVEDILKNPAFPEDEFEKEKNEQLASIENRRSDPQAIASLEMQRHLNPYPASDIRYTRTFDETVAGIKALTVEELRSFHKSFYGASDATAAIVGDFDEAAAREAMASMFGNWKSPAPFERFVGTVAPVETVNRTFETPDKANAVFFGAYNFSLRDDHPDYPALVLGHYMLGGGFLNSRLATRIRQKDGLSYGVGSRFQADALDSVGQFFAYAIYAPENAERVEQAFMEEIDRVIQEGFSDDEIAAAKSGWLQGQTVGRAQDGSVASRLGWYLYIDRDFTWEKSLEERVMNLSRDEINAAMKRHLTPQKINIIKAGDFAKVKAEAGE